MPLAEDSGLAVDVLQEQVERRDALRQPALDHLPLAGRQDAREQVVREDALRAVLLTVDREGDALVQECEVCRRLPLPELGRIDLGEPLEQRRVLRAGLARPVEHLVIRPVEHVTAERRPLVERPRTSLGSDGHAALVRGRRNAVKDRD